MSNCVCAGFTIPEAGKGRNPSQSEGRNFNHTIEKADPTGHGETTTGNIAKVAILQLTLKYRFGCLTEFFGNN